MAPGEKKRRVRRKKIPLRTLALVFLVGGGLVFTSLSLFLLFGPPWKDKAREALSSKKQSVHGELNARTPLGMRGKALKRGAGKESLPKVAIIIDDVGFDGEIARAFQELKPPVTLSVLPTAPLAQTIAREAMAKGVEVLLHLPMEPKEGNGFSLGSEILLDRMGEEEFLKTLRDHLNRIPGIKGVNNHMGSLLSEKEEKMGLIFRELKERRLFYVDSRTTPHTVACRVAAEVKVPAVSRSVFLDHELSQEAMKVQWDRLLEMAGQHGQAVGIAHPHRETLAFLKEHLRELISEARLVRVADIVS